MMTINFTLVLSILLLTAMPTLLSTQSNGAELTLLGSQQIDAGELEAALETFQKVTQLFPSVPLAWYNLGVAGSRAGDLGLAQEVRSCVFALGLAQEVRSCVRALLTQEVRSCVRARVQRARSLPDLPTSPLPSTGLSACSCAAAR